VELHGLSVELHSLSRIHSSICWQQSRVNWLRERDGNSKYFHGTMSSRWHVNNISIGREALAMSARLFSIISK